MLSCAPTTTRTRDLLLRRTWAVVPGPVYTQVSGHAEVSASDCHTLACLPHRARNGHVTS